MPVDDVVLGVGQRSEYVEGHCSGGQYQKFSHHPLRSILAPWGGSCWDGKWARNWRSDMKPFTLRGPQRGNFGGQNSAAVFRSHGSEATTFGILLNNRTARTEIFMAALFSTDANDPSEEKILNVWICKMRKKLKPYGVEIKTHWGECWRCPRPVRKLPAG
jgi:hypothetical protein